MSRWIFEITMTPKNLKIKKEDRSAALDYLKKATDNYEQMLLAIGKDNFNASATLALQCVISSADAVCVFEKGVRSISPNHLDVCDLVGSLPIKGAKEKSTLLRKIIAKKNLIQYERRNFYQKEALEVVKIATRFYQWVNEQISLT
ncbi:MAG: HEPN domain-containing protein [Candidatus Omnitrophota bacterium]